MITTLKLAGIPISITTQYESLTDAADDYKTCEQPLFSVELVEEDIANEYRKSVAEYAYEGLEYPGFTAIELENTAIYRKIANRLPEYDAMVFHGSAIAVDGQAYLFTAASGTGKTTHTNLWLKNIAGSYVVNGDKPVLRFVEKDNEKVLMVCGTPWMGKEALGCNDMVPLKGICFLNRGETNIINAVSFSDVMPQLIGQAYRPPEAAAMQKTLKLIEQIGHFVPLYELYCNMEDDAARVSYEKMSEKRCKQ